MQSQMVLGLPKFSEKNELCESCVSEKLHREPFDKDNGWRASCPLELVHTNLCGPMQNELVGGNKYFVTFIDERMC